MSRTTLPESPRTGLTSFALHMTAMALMLSDHLWGTFLYRYDILSYLGRVAFPLFAFLLTEGFRHTHDRKRYALRLLIFAAISEIPFNLLMERTLIYPFHQNVLWLFLSGVLLMMIYERIRRQRFLLVRLLCYLGITMLFYFAAFALFLDYHGSGILTIALFYFTGDMRSASLPAKLLTMGVQIAAMIWINCEIIAGLVITLPIFGFELEFHKQALALLALPLIWLYNGEQGRYSRRIRDLYYWFYPAHMALLGGILKLL